MAACIISGLVCVNSVKAEGGPTNTDNVTVNIKFSPIQSIVVTSAQKNVDILYASTDHYNNGVSVTKDDHLTVFSTGGFQVSVGTTTANFTRAGAGGGDIPVADVTVKAANGSTTNPEPTFADVALSTTPAALITTTKGGRDLKYSVTYDNTEGGSDKYIDKYISSDGTESVYTATVTYTIAAQ
jgi:hypothetical protein